MDTKWNNHQKQVHKYLAKIAELRESKKTKLRARKELMLSMRVKGCTLQEIGNEFGLSRERVRQILAKPV